MKRSQINQLVVEATACFSANGWALPPNPRWDVTDFGLGDWTSFGLVLVNLAEESEYCEKLMYARQGMITPDHFHRLKKEDIICRFGRLEINISSYVDGLKRNGQPILGAGNFILEAGERITIPPMARHAFSPISMQCIIGEVSTANDDLRDNIFSNALVGRFTQIEEDEPPLVRLVSDE